jgi:twitching motility protein PilU
MQTFDIALYNLFKAGKITLDEALKNADGANNLRLKIELGEKGESVAAVESDEGDESASAEGESKQEAKDDPLAGLSLIVDVDEDEEEEAENGMASFSLPDEGKESTG